MAAKKEKETSKRSSAKKEKETLDRKSQDLETFREVAQGENLTTNQGLPINNDQNSLKTGTRGLQAASAMIPFGILSL